MIIEIEYLHEGMSPLKRSHCYDAGADVPMYKDITVKKGKNVIPLGFKVTIPPGYAGYLSPRSSVMGDGTTYNMVPIDTDYSGEVNLVCYNPVGDFVVKKNERLCQLIIMPVLVADFREKKDIPERRGSGGLGSTGK